MFSSYRRGEDSDWQSVTQTKLALLFMETRVILMLTHTEISASLPGGILVILESFRAKNRFPWRYQTHTVRSSFQIQGSQTFFSSHRAPRVIWRGKIQTRTPSTSALWPVFYYIVQFFDISTWGVRRSEAISDAFRFKFSFPNEKNPNFLSALSFEASSLCSSTANSAFGGRNRAQMKL